jgi:hypothetical protein
MNRIANPQTAVDSSRLHPLVFEVAFEAPLNPLTPDSGLTGHSVVVQVESDGLSEVLALTTARPARPATRRKRWPAGPPCKPSKKTFLRASSPPVCPYGSTSYPRNCKERRLPCTPALLWLG